MLNLLEFCGLVDEMAEARRRGIGITRGELVGLAPRAALEGRAPESVGLAGLSDSNYLETYL